MKIFIGYLYLFFLCTQAASLSVGPHVRLEEEVDDLSKDVDEIQKKPRRLMSSMMSSKGYGYHGGYYYPSTTSYHYYAPPPATGYYGPGFGPGYYHAGFYGTRKHKNDMHTMRRFTHEMTTHHFVCGSLSAAAFCAQEATVDTAMGRWDMVGALTLADPKVATILVMALRATILVLGITGTMDTAGTVGT